MTTAVYMAILKDCVPLEYKVKTFPNPIVTSEENLKKIKIFAHRQF